MSDSSEGPEVSEGTEGSESSEGSERSEVSEGSFFRLRDFDNSEFSVFVRRMKFHWSARNEGMETF